MNDNLMPIQVEGVRVWIAHTLTQVIDNHEPLYTAVQRAVRLAVDDVETMSGKPTAPSSRTVYRNRVASAAGDAVQDVLRAYLSQVPQPMGTLLVELLDFSDNTQWATIGEHYADDITGQP